MIDKKVMEFIKKYGYDGFDGLDMIGRIVKDKDLFIYQMIVEHYIYKKRVADIINSFLKMYCCFKVRDFVEYFHMDEIEDILNECPIDEFDKISLEKELTDRLINIEWTTPDDVLEFEEVWKNPTDEIFEEEVIEDFGGELT